ncbi:17-beta-hydroxysteroid dehydrogenase 14-like [Mya arenaria]|uniref:17-beta-hydroxysteroid dehydrogenase 14-like n=1 Tax=Mya arenaria TaxID=6604 RepID=UPI0022E4382D|nr:17-beta-hydroxysteroid dehydrogenase 14-like [Mya arenaria]
MSSELRFEKKVAIVTGGCQGIGKGCSEILAENGGTVLVFDINDTLGESISSKGPGKIIYMRCDVTNEAQVKTCIDKVIEKYGQIDCIVNNVGTHPGDVEIDHISVQDFRDILELNVVSHFTMYKYGLPYLRKTKGSVVSIASFSGTNGQRACPTYCCTKGAIPALAKALAIDEAKNGVRINTICPGPIRTPLYEDWLAKLKNPEDGERVKAWTQLGRIGDPREIGKACLFLATDATFTTGTELMCTGGCEIGYGVKD